MNENKNTEKKTSFNMKHGSTTYIVNVRFAEESKTTFGDILKRSCQRTASRNLHNSSREDYS